MLINPGRPVPVHNALNRYAVNLGQTAAEVKEYFDVSVYRNVLDMLTTFEGVLNRWGDDLYNNALLLSHTKMFSTIVPGTPLTQLAQVKISGVAIPHKFLRGSNTAGMIGYAISKVGNIPNAPAMAVPTLTTNTLKANGFPGLPASSGGWMAFIDLRKYVKPSGYFAVPDLLNLARQINWELNRVRLPVPHNFRQINDKIQGRPYTMLNIGTKTDPFCDENCRSSFINKMTDKNFINLIEFISVYRQLKTAINTLRVSTRKEIDAANVAKKVQEETIRSEQEELISREQAAKEAEQRELQVLAEKKAAYEKELAEADKMKQELAATRAELAAELETLQAAKESAANVEEITAIEEKETEVINAAVHVDSVESDMTKSAQTAVIASQNLNREIVEVEKQLQDKGVLPEKKGNIAPLLLTLAAGYLLT